ncbi:MAG: hypothetical protein AAFZ58_12365 [Pseudomonadota bacterium]
MVNHWHSVSIGVASFDAVSALWIDRFGFDVEREHAGDDASLARLWALPSGSIDHQWWLTCPGQSAGRLHIVQFSTHAGAVRDGAQSFDLCPKNLDVYVDDIARRVDELRAAGLRFRNDAFSDVVAPDGTHFREIHLPAHDGLNVVLLEVVGKSLPFTRQGYLGVGPLVTTVPDADAERAFYRELGFEPLAHNVLAGAEIERMIGLPAGATLDVSMLGEPANPLGEMEIIRYGGTNGADLYPRARAPARGILEIHAYVDDPSALAADPPTNAQTSEHIDVGASLLGRGPVCRLRTPAGFAVNLWRFSGAA